MNLKDFRYDGEGSFKLKDYKTSEKLDKELKDDVIAHTEENIERIAELQTRLYADGKEGLVIILQALDAAGKDSTIKHVMSGINPQGVKVHSFKTPSKEELAHDYLWRAITHLPERGYIGLFNRSYYEDVLVVRVHEMWTGYAWPKRCYDMDDKEFFDMRFRQIRDFEQYLYENGYRVVKLFLNVSKEEQAERFLERIEEEDKNWKFSTGDLEERALWDSYIGAFESCIASTSTKRAPWYIIPADQKWVMQNLVSQVILDTLEDMDPQYPQLPEDEAAKLEEYRAQLLAELEED